MPITDRTRKILWGKSGNKCAMCRHTLVVEPTWNDSESVVGEECHIISGSENGPRYDKAYPTSKIDDISNLVLLCRIHHKQVDDQTETYTTILLRQMKQNHEIWVEQKLKEQPEEVPFGIRRIRKNIPGKLGLMKSGKDLLNLASGCHGSYQDYSEDLNDEETEFVGGFFQDVSDWTDLTAGFEPLEKMNAAKSIDDLIKRLNEQGFKVFAATEDQRLEGGINKPSTFRVLHLSVKRTTDPDIVS